jgi:hypothetical protein
MKGDVGQVHRGEEEEEGQAEVKSRDPNSRGGEKSDSSRNRLFFFVWASQGLIKLLLSPKIRPYEGLNKALLSKGLSKLPDAQTEKKNDSSRNHVFFSVWAFQGLIKPLLSP